MLQVEPTGKRPHAFAPPRLGVNPLEFRHNLWCQKNRVPGLLGGIVCVILSLADSIGYRRATGSHRHTTDDGIYRGKNRADKK